MCCYKMFFILCLCLVLLVMIINLGSERENFDEMPDRYTPPFASRYEIPPDLQDVKTYVEEFDRFYFQLFEELDFQNRITRLKDAHSNYLPFITNRPIRSIKLQAKPNDNNRFTQHFSLMIFLKDNPTKVVEFRFYKYSGYTDHSIPNTIKEGWDWMNTNQDKVILFTTNIYNPMLDVLPWMETKIKPLHQDFYASLV